MTRKQANFVLINSRTGTTVGYYTTLKSARRALDKKDNEYGAYVHRIINNVLKRATI